MLTCIIRYQIDPTRHAEFVEYAQRWNTAIPRCGAHLTGYYAPHEGSSTLAYGIYDIKNLAEYEAYRYRLKQDSQGLENFEYAQRHKFIQREDRCFFKRITDTIEVSA